MSDELPEGWAAAPLFDLCEPKQWSTISTKQLTESGYPVYGANGKIGFYSKYNHEKPTILITCRGATCGRLNVSEPFSWVNGNAMALDGLKSGCIDMRLALYALQNRGLEDTISGSAQPQITRTSLKPVALPLPPLAEQQRIVAKVEELLSRVNAARQRLAKAPAILKRFRQSVLAAACAGRLTADWREENESTSVVAALALTAKDVDQKAIRHLVRRGSAGLPELELPDSPETWIVQTVREMVETGAILDFQDGNHGSLYPRESDFGESGVRFVTAQQVFDNRVEIDKAPFLKQEKADVLRIGFTIPGDVLLTHNATVGRVALLPEYNGPVILGTSVTYYRANPSVLLPAFLAFQMQGNFWQDQLRSVMEQTTRNQVSVTKQVEFRLFVPPLAEQHEFVRRVERLFKLADAIEKRVAAVTARADKLTQAILAKAFRGELVPTEAELARKEGRDYEPASVLLERIKASTDCTDSTDLKTGRMKPIRKTHRR